MKIERKDFIKMGAGAVVGGLTGATFSGAPFHGLQWLVEWSQDQYRPAPGDEKYVQAICDACPDKCQMTIRKIGPRAVKVETSNSGCPLGQEALQLLYHPDRVLTPLKLSGKKGSLEYEKVTWEKALADISAKMNEQIKKGSGNLIAGVNKDLNLSAELLDLLVQASGSPHTYYESSLESLSMAALGGNVQYDFSNTDYVLSFGAKLFEGWGNSAQMRSALLSLKERGAKVVQVDTNCSRTTSMADEWVPVKPGTECVMALGIANQLVKMGRRSGAAGYGNWIAIVNQYTPNKVSEITGVPAEKIIKIAAAFNRARNPVAVAGRGAEGVSSSSAELAAVYGLNSMVNSKAATLVQPVPVAAPKLTPAATQSMKASKKSAGLDDFIKTGNFEVLLVNGADPAYKSVYGSDLAKKLEKAFVVAITPLINDTAAYADYILPPLTFLEAATPANGAAVEPRNKAIHAGDIVIQLARKVDGAAASFPWTGYLDAIAQSGKTKGAGNFALNAGALKKHLESLDKASKDSKYPLSLVPMEVEAIGDGDGMAFPYVNKITHGKIYATDRFIVRIGYMRVHMNSATAKKYGAGKGEGFNIESSRGKIGKVKIHITDTVAPDTIAIPLGFGHKAYTRYASEKGVNPKEIMSNEIDPLTGTADWWLTRVKLS